MKTRKTDEIFQQIVIDSNKRTDDLRKQIWKTIFASKVNVSDAAFVLGLVQSELSHYTKGELWFLKEKLMAEEQCFGHFNVYDKCKTCDKQEKCEEECKRKIDSL